MSEFRPGHIIDHYEILDVIGRGGMGVVYRARDTRLKRTVALKALAPHLIGVDDRARFLREATAVASLHHPNIATVFEILEDDGQPFIAFEYVDGQTLDERIREGPLPLEEALRIASQIAAGLAEAHANEIVHRDIKSSNVMLSRSGTAKILDFGLAKTLASTKLTQMGSTLGTVAYMSPEQAAGEDVDARTDIWSLGVVIYEMIAGRLPFRGDYEQAVIYGIVNEEPDPLTSIRTGVPMACEAIVSKCLSKDRKLRYQSVSDLIVDIQRVDVSSGGSTRISTRLKPQAARSGLRSALPWVIAAIVLVAILSWWNRQPVGNGAREPIRLSIVIPADHSLSVATRALPLTFTVDGKELIYVGEREGTTHLFRRPLDVFEPAEIPNTEGASLPFVSPDGRWIGYFSRGRIMKIPTVGGSPFEICEAPTAAYGATWTRDDAIIFSSFRGGLSEVSADGGSPRQLTRPDTSQLSLGHYWPSVLPDDEHVVFATSRIRSGILGVYSRTTGEWTAINRNADSDEPFEVRGNILQTHYLPERLLLYGHNFRVWALPFDVDELVPLGPPTEVVSDVYEAGNNGAVFFDVSRKGDLVFVPGGNEHELVLVDRQGRESSLFVGTNQYRFPTFDPTDNLVAVTIDADPDPSQIWILDLQREIRRRLTSEGHNLVPLWSQDGRRVLYASSGDIYEIDVEGMQAPTLLYEGGEGIGWATPISISPAGEIAFHEATESHKYDIRILKPDGTSFLFRHSPASEYSPAFAPNGDWLAYTSDETGRPEIYLESYPQHTRRIEVSTDGGHESKWSADGRELYYRNGDDMMVVSISGLDTNRPSVGRPQLLFTGTYDARHNESYDVSSDGQRFLMVKLDPKASPTHFQVVLNWADHL